MKIKLINVHPVKPFAKSKRKSPILFNRVKAKEIFTRTKLPGAKWVINQYVGCEHACLYCYAKFISRWRPDSYGKWGSWVEAKINAPELVHPVKSCKAGISPKAKLSNRVKGRYVDGWVFMSSISDPYQPVEKKLKLTRRILENMDKSIKLAVQTKSDLVLRDIDLFKQFKTIEVGLTINSFKGRAKKLFEPESPSNGKRIQVLKILKENGLKTYAFVSPIIPGLIDIKDVISKTKKYADYYWFEFINIRGAGKEFSQILKKEFPESYEVVTDKTKFQQFIKECKQVITSAKIKVRGIVLH